jgi:NADPH-dependent glutamate synthase beta subunit-like oxidoreductase/ferredoxin
VTGAARDPAATESVLTSSMIHPRREEKLPPCCGGCLSGGDVRDWIGVVAQRRKLGLSDEESFREAWNILSAVNPFPATMGRVCPHPCESGCNRTTKDGPVAVNALERFLGDWAIANQVALPRLEETRSRPESIGVIGAGPAGLSFAYQMARRGYWVTVYEKEEKPGGMLYHGIPQYRLPGEVLESEIGRILDLGVELRLGTVIGRDVSVSELRERHAILFLGIGAGRGLRLGIPGEDGAGSWTGTAYLSQINQGIPVELGRRVVVVGGGNTAVDAARTARRSCPEVTLLYRRTREEMPAIDAEVEDALQEGVGFEFLAAPVEVRRQDGAVRAVVVRRMTLGEPDASGRRAPVPVPGSDYELPADSIIAAVSQEPDWEGLLDLKPDSTWVKTAPDGAVRDDLWAGGDSRGLGLAGLAIGQGREAAEAAHARLAGLPVAPVRERAPVSSGMVTLDFVEAIQRAAPPRLPPGEWLTDPDAEIQGTITEEEFLQEVSRCLSCGYCYGCEQCFMYCNADAIVPSRHPRPGNYFELRLDRCQACGKCVDLCPCGFLSPD